MKAKSIHWLRQKYLLALRLSICCLLANGFLVHADSMDDLVKAQLRENHLPGLSLAIIDGGKIVKAQGYGFADASHTVPVTDATLFQAASISKPVTALAALRLVEQGKLSLDENVNDRLRSWKVPENEFTRDKKVTLRGLLSHSAGLTIHGFSGYEVGAPLPTLLQS